MFMAQPDLPSRCPSPRQKEQDMHPRPDDLRLKEAAPSSPSTSTLHRRSLGERGGPTKVHLGLWVVTSAVWTLMISYVGRRTPIHSLLCFPPCHFLLLALVTRGAALVSGRLRRQVPWTVRSCVGGAAWSHELYRPVGVLLALATIGETVAVGSLELGMALALQVLLPAALLILSPYFGLAAPSVYSPTGLAALISPLLVGTVSSSVVPSFLALLCGVAGVAAQAGIWLLLGQEWSEKARGTTQSFQVLWHVAPMAALLSGLVAGLNLLLHLPLSESLHPPPSFLLLLVFSSILYFVNLDFACAVLFESGTNIVNSSLATVPRALLVSLGAGIGGLGLANQGLYHAALGVGVVVVGWARSSPVSDDVEENTAVSEKGWTSPRRQTSLTSTSPSGSPYLGTGGDFSPLLRSSPPGSPRRPSLVGRRPVFSAFSFLALLPFLPFLPILLQAIHPFPPLPLLPTDRLPIYLKNRIGLYHRAHPHFTPPTMDIVFAYFNASIAEFDEHVQHVRGRGSVKRYKTRISVYSKGGADPSELKKIEGVDEVIELENVGREGGTYLNHIIRRFAKPAPDDPFGGTQGHGTSHADLTLFLQHHLAWQWIADQRFDYPDDRTGYIALGPYRKNDCGRDLDTEGKFERMKDIYVMFQEDFCPPTLQLTSWAAQFVVSRKRIVGNPVKKYERLLELLQAPGEHWLYNEGVHFQWHGEMGPSNPFLGHALERAWPVIFNCTDPKIVDNCPDDLYDSEKCQCFDWK